MPNPSGTARRGLDGLTINPKRYRCKTSPACSCSKRTLSKKSPHQSALRSCAHLSRSGTVGASQRYQAIIKLRSEHSPRLNVPVEDTCPTGSVLKLISDRFDRVSHDWQHRMGVGTAKCALLSLMHDHNYEQCGRGTSVRSVMYSVQSRDRKCGLSSRGGC